MDSGAPGGRSRGSGATDECLTAIGRERPPSRRRSSFLPAGSGSRRFSAALVQWRM